MWQKWLLTWFLGPMWLVTIVWFGPLVWDAVRDRGDRGDRRTRAEGRT
jgi:hypothetical protein